MTTRTRTRTRNSVTRSASPPNGPRHRRPTVAALELVAQYPNRVIRRHRDGFVLARYGEIGNAGVSLVEITEHIVHRGASQWWITPTPDLVVSDIIATGDAIGVVASWVLLGDGPSHEHRSLLTFAPRNGALEYAGQLEAPVAVANNGLRSQYMWDYAIESSGLNCLSLAAFRA